MKKGISLVALVITIIVLIILTAAVFITGASTPSTAKIAVFKSDAANVQDAVTLYRLNYMAENAGQLPPLYAADATATPINSVAYYPINVASSTLNLTGIDVTDGNWLVSENGVVMHKTGFKNTVDSTTTYYNVGYESTTAQEGATAADISTYKAQ